MIDAREDGLGIIDFESRETINIANQEMQTGIERGEHKTRLRAVQQTSEFPDLGFMREN
jgi:hypothetical protein